MRLSGTIKNLLNVLVSCAFLFGTCAFGFPMYPIPTGSVQFTLGCSELSFDSGPNFVLTHRVALSPSNSATPWSRQLPVTLRATIVDIGGLNEGTVFQTPAIAGSVSMTVIAPGANAVAATPSPTPEPATPELGDFADFTVPVSRRRPVTPAPVKAVLPGSPISNDRILGMIPNFQTVSDPNKPFTPLRVRDKWELFMRESVDPFAFFSAAAGAGISQLHNEDPKYGVGFKPYMQRFGAAQADLTSQNFFQDCVLASLFHEDPRYFRKGPGSTVLRRIAYAVSRAAIVRRDSGKDSFNFSGIVGMELGIALSNAYYPPKSVNRGEMAYRSFTSLTASALGNLAPEFWPDIKARLAGYKHRYKDIDPLP
jgi:hypothetical protein